MCRSSMSLNMAASMRTMATCVFVNQRSLDSWFGWTDFAVRDTRSVNVVAPAFQSRHTEGIGVSACTRYVIQKLRPSERKGHVRFGERTFAKRESDSDSLVGFCFISRRIVKKKNATYVRTGQQKSNINNHLSAMAWDGIESGHDLRDPVGRKPPLAFVLHTGVRFPKRKLHFSLVFL